MVAHGKESTFSAGNLCRSLDWEDPLEKGMAPHSSLLAWRIPWTEETGLVGYSPWGRKELDATKQLCTHTGIK